MGDVRHKNDGFKGLWKRVKPLDKPEEVAVSFSLFDDLLFKNNS